MKSSAPSVAVIGAGVAGLACALALKSRGARVRVFDPRRGGMNASLAAAGMLGALSESLSEPDSAHGGALALRIEALRAWPAFAARIGADAQAALTASGCLMIARTSERAHALHTLAREAAAAEMSATLLDGAAVRARAPFLATMIAGLFLADEAQVNPAAMHAAMAARVGPIEIVRIQTIAREGAQWRVSDACFDELVIATGASTDFSPIAPSLSLLRPASGDVVVLESNHAMACTVRAESCYVAAVGGSAVVGGVMDFDEARTCPDPQRVAALRGAYADIFPAAATHMIEARAGVRPMSPDWAPLIGRDGPDGAIVAIGHSRNGWLLAPVTGAIVAAHVFGDDVAPRWAALSPQRFHGVR